jgi:Mn2+/Fe2+ NRAMP family transporter
MSYDLSRLRRADQIVGGGAIALFIFMFFFKWYGISSNIGTISGVNLNASYSGWHTFTNSRWIWLLTIIVALVSLVMVAGSRKLDGPLQASLMVAALGALSTLLILYRIVHHPTASASAGGFHASAGIKIGIWLGLIAAAAITYGGYLQMQAEGTSLTDVREKAGDAFSGVTVPTEPAARPADTPAEQQQPPTPPSGT